MHMEENHTPDVMDRRIIRLLQTPPEAAGVWVEEFDEKAELYE